LFNRHEAIEAARTPARATERGEPRRHQLPHERFEIQAPTFERRLALLRERGQQREIARVVLGVRRHAPHVAKVADAVDHRASAPRGPLPQSAAANASPHQAERVGWRSAGASRRPRLRRWRSSGSRELVRHDAAGGGRDELHRIPIVS
jgi:hypothetical protein